MKPIQLRCSSKIADEGAIPYIFDINVRIFLFPTKFMLPESSFNKISSMFVEQIVDMKLLDDKSKLMYKIYSFIHYDLCYYCNGVIFSTDLKVCFCEVAAALSTAPANTTSGNALSGLPADRSHRLSWIIQRCVMCESWKQPVQMLRR